MKTAKISLFLMALCAASTSFSAVVYQQTSTTGLTTSSATPPTALDDITFSSSQAGFELSSLTFGVGVLPGTTAQTGVVFVDFYDTFNAASGDVVESNYLGGFGGNLNISANTGTGVAARAFTFNNLQTLSSPIVFTDNNVAIVITFADSTGTSYSSVLVPLTSVPGVPTIGSSVTGVYRDSDGDGDFEASELVPGQGNLYLSISTIAVPVPEPSTYAMFLSGGAVALLAWRARRAS